MKNLIFFALLLLAVNAGAQTVPVPLSKAKEVLIAAKQQRICEKQLDSLNVVISDLQIEKSRLTTVVANDHDRDSLSVRQLALASDQLEQSQQQRAILNKHIDELDRALTKAKRGKRFIAGLGIVATVIAAILF